MIELAKYTKEFSELLGSTDNILLISHINPDGDAIGSQIALYRFLSGKGMRVEMMCPNNLQEFLKWMDGSDKINVFIRKKKKCKQLIENAGLIVMLDFNQPNRLGEAESLVISSRAPKVIIDHHLEPLDFADLLISDPSKCSTAELVHEIVTILNGEPFRDRSYSESVYVGIITDTGNFEYGAYTGNTMRVVADLLDTGIDRGNVLNTVYNNFSAERIKLMGFSLYQRMTVLEEYRTAYIYLTKKDLADFKHVKGDTEGFVNLPLSIKGIVFSVFFMEKDSFVKISFRSKGNFPSNEFASRYFSGGGHLNASGGEYYDTLDNTIAYFLKVLKEEEALLLKD